jgi:hypothetical protein
VAAKAVADPDILVRLAGMQTLTWALQTKPRIVKQHIPAAMPSVYKVLARFLFVQFVFLIIGAFCKETVIDQSLIKVIDLGQMKHITDHGLDKV